MLIQNVFLNENVFPLLKGPPVAALGLRLLQVRVLRGGQSRDPRPQQDVHLFLQATRDTHKPARQRLVAHG